MVSLPHKGKDKKIMEKTEFRAGDCVSLSCDGAPRDCSSITWLFSYKNGTTDTLFEGGKFKSEGKKGRLHVTKECSLEVKLLRKRKDVGRYTCRSFPSADVQHDHATHQLELMTSTNRSTTTTVKANTTCTSTSKPTTPAVKGAASSSPTSRPPSTSTTPTTHNTTNGGSPTAPPSRGLYIGVGVALGTAVLLIVGLVLLIRWLRRRGNKRPKDTTTIDLNSIRDTPPVIGGLHDQHLSVDGDQGGGPTYASIVLPEGQRSVATAQVEDDSSDAVTYSSVRASPRGGEKAGDVDVHYATVNKRGK
ncbi:uncharacterized protein LOC115534118 isoform X2 [Gadus morhua]|uniref:uncharacterized protein LOC115534118 isoform X2 n=2 Tax=Gadus morhua TaxID=8049 RepID=UPI0011B83E45|nr:uncharacterized protein LOC115534118 isoform X2 [Gadus morhua]